MGRLSLPLNIKITNLWVSYNHGGQHWLIKDLGLDLSGGECVGIIGNNGSGKSTFAFALLGIIPQLTPGNVKGSVFFDNINILSEDISTRLQHIGYSFQDVESQILFGNVADIIGINEIGSDKDILKHAIECFQISHLLDRNPEQLSGGESQKVALTAALRLGPTFILYDEATSALDPQTRKVFKKIINYLNDLDKNIVLIGQRYEMLSHYCDKVLLLKNGCLNLYNPLDSKISEINADGFYDLINGAIKNFQPLQLELNIKGISFIRKRSNFKLGPLDIDIMPGETIALVGPNGSGKTTFLLLLNGLLKASSGHYSLNGESFNLTRRNLLSQNTFMVTQSPLSQIIGTSIREELSFASGFANIINDARKTDILLSYFPFLEFQKDPLQLSYGQQRLLTMICALLSNKPILLIDEPEQGLDEISLNYIKTWFLRNRQAKRKTVIFSTHDLKLAASIADRCLLFLDGNIKSEIKADKLGDVEDWYFKHTGKIENA